MSIFPQSKFAPNARRYCTGVTMVELMVAITIGVVLIFGAGQMYVDGKQSYEVNESVARLQETARYALSVLEPDIRMANNWGLMNDPVPITDNSTALNTCGVNFAPTRVAESIRGDDNGMTFTCGTRPTGGSGAVVSADTITVRHGTYQTQSPASGTLQICSTLTAATISSAYVAGDCPTTLQQRLVNLVSNIYYVSRDSDQAMGMPALRRKWITTDGTAPKYDDVEIIPGVEDMQFQYGIAATANSTEATQYVNTWNANQKVVAVRLWLLVRAESPEAGFVDNTTYQYGDRSSTGTGVTNDLNAANAAGRAYQPGDGYRRLLISRTIQLRSAYSRNN